MDGASHQTVLPVGLRRNVGAVTGFAPRANPLPWAFAERVLYVNITPVCFPFARNGSFRFPAAMTGNGQIAAIVVPLPQASLALVPPVEVGRKAAILASVGR
jgi:hypothetical protein